jgi:DNA-binding IclR family transcriptional regulator
MVAVHDNHGVMVAGLSISAPRDRRQDAWIPLLKKAGDQLSARLGYRPAGM